MDNLPRFLRMFALAVFVALPVLAQAPALPERVALVADRVSVDAETGALIAEGNVTIIRGDTVVQTDRLIYDDRSGTVTVPGELTLQQADGAVLYADYAALDPDLRTGVIEGARALIDNQLQVAASAARQLDGRFTVLDRVVASSCVICEDNPVPIWKIRAERVIRDAEELQFHYENAVFEMFGVPVLYLPYFRHPDPSVARASGFLNPEFSAASTYGFGLKLPYYHVIDDSRDVTLTPFVTSDEGVLVEGEYRQALDRGYLELDGVVKLNEDDGDAFRGFLSAFGNYALGDRIVARLDATVLSDDAFLTEYSYSNQDVVTSSLSLERFVPDSFWTVETAYFDTLRENEDQDTVPFVLPQAEYRRAFDLGTMRGEVNADLLSFSREIGRDVMRASVGGGLDRTVVTAPGLVLRGFTDVAGDLYAVADDPVDGDFNEARARGQIGLEMRMPFIARGARLTQIVEPIVQLVLAEETGDPTDVPNEDSLLLEFDETSLFSTNRFPGLDRFETGAYANVGLRYESITPSGRNITGTVGRVYRDDALGSFPAGSGLAGVSSDFLVAFGYEATERLSLSGSFLTDSNLDFSRSEFGFVYTDARLDLAADYVYLEADAVTPVDRAEVQFDMGYRFDPNWAGSLNFRRDMENDAFLRAGAGVSWGNECAEFEFSVSRRFTRSNNVDPSTEFGLTFRLAGIGVQGSAAERRRQSCGI
ncbi:LPS-assembly protein LptD [Roseobacter sp. HKCCA0434]|uniref:LPS-assembly protein LptD n=1 Tax=Roseobacter sp. HKCCA0434 TaxID=3079297 RepID=UPI002905A2CB|nr:LPS assembly protein LptD [Roseobacter sp. HKCCA0434]